MINNLDDLTGYLIISDNCDPNPIINQNPPLGTVFNIGDDPFEVSDALTMFNYVTTDSPVGRQLTLNLEERLNSKEQIGS